jgi:hypothetical protein
MDGEGNAIDRLKIAEAFMQVFDDQKFLSHGLAPAFLDGKIQNFSIIYLAK